ncbi:DUF983 domain-containing protein [Hyphobacterium sp. CCMP332]|uniref:DUF983 domain-containing protein n=1 Tax=Hyphobacterium sp. CCMP332 TaxID=2749086 RepID=UPI001F3E77BC|nr:DUF983 domain-containing protein [Hyphobacterium sp. CCMP332]
MTTLSQTGFPSLMTACWRGFRLLCPHCGRARLFTRYLKPVEVCGHCGADYSDIRADDGPAWLTVLLMGPFLVPLAFGIAVSGWPAVFTYPVLAVVIVGSVLLLLPRMKGVVIGVLHVSRLGK